MDAMVKQGLPPIVGTDGGSTWFGNGGHMRFNLPPVPINAGFSLLLDLQAETDRIQCLIGGRDGEGALTLTVNTSGAGTLTLHCSDGAGARLEKTVPLSPGRAKRVLVTCHPGVHEICVYELHPWAANPGHSIPGSISSTGTLSRIGPGSGKMALGGLLDGEEVHSPFTGRAAEFACFTRVLGRGEVDGLAAASTNPTALSLAGISMPSAEAVDRFRRDLGRLRRWATKSAMDRDDLDDASVLVSRWLFDQHPLFANLCRHFAVQLWLPGRTEADARYWTTVKADEPLLQVRGAFRGPFGSTWRTLDEWAQEALVALGEYDITAEQFVKVVRNKLGGAHFDERDRSRWQRDLPRLIEQVRIAGMDILSFQMKEVIGALLQSVEVTGMDALAS